ncbi:hypothetical protein N8T08_005831 [Aspergillus melleus]|uniref:Uncharacterized protein n=1 Tax=Aspergillus melleus TaxID=138277 RepID=A0ACC3B1P4_9EURO|nr:hypothetical protein N8T08_005831 [Aspergillus melleus]
MAGRVERLALGPAVINLAQYVAEYGPFDAVMGFSLGTALALTLLLNHEQLGLSVLLFGCAILLCGILPCGWSALE